MTDDRLSAVQRHFDQAASIPPADRVAFLAEACADDAALRDEVASLLRSADGAGGFLEHQAIDQVLPALRGVAEPAALIGRCVGAYRIEKLIGAGGMGVVYLARQSDPERLVALKLIPPALATPRLVRRLHAEAQVLGRLRHPGIAQIYEAGCASADAGPQPFFAMEYVPGESLVRYADARDLSVPERLELLARVCDALHHAHQQGVIHRDLKPQNILVVEADEGDRPAQPKIIDFGVARVTDTAEGAPADRTAVDRLAGTPSYMSPEQFHDPWGGLDVRSDIYAMGVISYELLTGRLPHDMRDRTIAEAARTVMESTPPPPGTLNRALRGDVEIILMTALARDKERRYQSASGLAADLRRAIRGEPITARPPSFWYELSRHAGRNRLVYAALVAAFLLLLAGTIGTSVGVLRARANARAMAQAYDESEAVTAFVQRMISSIDPHELGRRDVPMREVVDRMSAALEVEFPDRPLVRARLHEFIGRTLWGIGLFNESAPHLRQAVEIRHRTLGPDHPRTIESTELLGSVVRDLGNLGESARLLADVLERRRRLLGAEHEETVEACCALATTYFRMGRFDDAEALLVPAWERARTALGDRHEITLDLMEWVANAYTYRGGAGRAEPLIREVHEVRIRELGESHPLTLRAANALSRVYLEEGHLADAEGVAARTYDLRRELLGETHPATLNAAGGLGRVWMELARYDEAHRLFGLVVDARRELGAGQRTLEALLDLASSWRALGQPEEAMAAAEEAYGTARRDLGEDHPTTLSAVSAIASAHQQLGQVDQARGLWSELLLRQRAVLGADHPRTLDTMHDLAVSLSFDAARLEEAAARLEELLEIRRRELGAEHPHALSTAGELGRVYLLLGRIDEALAVLTEAVEAGRRSLPEDHWQLGVWIRTQGACLASLGRFPEAEGALREAERILELRLGAGHAEAVEAAAKLEALGGPARPGLSRPTSPAGAPDR